MMRVVSLLASATEIMHALGKGSWLVGRSHECDFPKEVLSLPRCSDPAISVDGTSAEIDRAIKTAARNALSIYRVHDHLLRELRPDLILTQTQCEVCAVSLKDVEDAYGARVVALNPRTLDDVFDDIRRVAGALGCADEGLALGKKLHREFAILQAETENLDKPKVAVLEWLDPLMGAGHWIPRLVEYAGGRSVLKAGRITPEDLRLAAPDVIIAAPCGYPLGKTLQERRLLEGLPGRVWAADGNAYFNRSGPRLVDTARMIDRMLRGGEDVPGVYRRLS